MSPGEVAGERSSESVPDFAQMEIPAPGAEDLKARGEAFERELSASSTPEEILGVLKRIDGLRRDLTTWSALVHIRFSQNTQDEEAARRKEYHDRLKPLLAGLSVRLKRLLLGEPYRSVFEKTYGRHLLNLWRAEVGTFTPQIAEKLAEEANLSTSYEELLGGATVSFRGKTLTLPALGRYMEDPDRTVRFQAQSVKWQWVSKNAEKFDLLYSSLVKLRDGMARALGFADFVDLAYLRMARTDFVPPLAARFRELVLKLIVPLARKIKSIQKKQLAVEELFFWDEPLWYPQGNPAPRGGPAELLAEARLLFRKLDPQLSTLLSLMEEKHLLDLETRPGKSGGGFCSSLPRWGVPFVFANFNGTRGDVEVFTHEMGHAFAAWRSAAIEPLEYKSPTAEVCEIHSMGLEFLSWPHLELFFSEQAERFRKLHLAKSIAFLPYCAAVDQFQEEVYRHPGMEPADRLRLWRDLERRYLPWRSYGDLPALGEGRLWQTQRHIYLWPFYYLDYGLALTCALQLWLIAREKPGEALRIYTDLCGRGGSAPAGELVASVGIASPFEEKTLRRIAREAEAYLGIS